MKKKYKTNYSINECIKRFMSFDEHEIEDNIKFKKQVYPSKVRLKVSKVNNYLSSGIYKNAYKDIVCEFSNVNSYTEIKISTPLKIRHKLVFVCTLAVFWIIAIINLVTVYLSLGWNIKMALEILMLLLFSAICTLIFYFAVNIKRNTNISILAHLLSLFDCKEL